MSTAQNNAKARVKSFIDRLVRLHEEKAKLMEDIKEVRKEAKSEGWNVKAIDKLVAMIVKDTSDKEAELMNEIMLYADAAGVQLDLSFPDDPTPLEAAIEATKGDRFDPVRAMAEGIASGDERITKAASFPAGTSIEITPSASRADWPDDLPTRFVSDGGVLRPEAVQ